MNPSTRNYYTISKNMVIDERDNKDTLNFSVISSASVYSPPRLTPNHFLVKIWNIVYFLIYQFRNISFSFIYNLSSNKELYRKRVSRLKQHKKAIHKKILVLPILNVFDFKLYFLFL